MLCWGHPILAGMGCCTLGWPGASWTRLGWSGSHVMAVLAAGIRTSMAATLRSPTLHWDATAGGCPQGGGYSSATPQQRPCPQHLQSPEFQLGTWGCKYSDKAPAALLRSLWVPVKGAQDQTAAPILLQSLHPSCSHPCTHPVPILPSPLCTSHPTASPPPPRPAQVQGVTGGD